MRRLLDQIIKFGLIGVLCTLIDIAVFSFINYAAGMDYTVATFFGFVVSVVVNYILSMKYVFARKDDLDRKKEFIIFVVLSVIGLGLNEVIIYGCVDGIYMHAAALQGLFGRGSAEFIGKIAATGLVMVYNFISRKIFLEKKA